ncbi:hypothetical protein DOM21_16450 [Bacteriovorax stolpii]|nr:hypothetical protein DOM21_16450 [Bacteriovorax stolpii]
MGLRFFSFSREKEKRKKPAAKKMREHFYLLHKCSEMNFFFGVLAAIGSREKEKSLASLGEKTRP